MIWQNILIISKIFFFMTDYLFLQTIFGNLFITGIRYLLFIDNY